jgi:glycosyltransferase involved in cell wall biosynthesis
MNKGIALATGEVIGFLNAGDIYTNDNVLRRVARVMEDEQLDACYGDLVYVDQNDTDRVTRYWKSRPYEAGLCRSGWMPAHPTFFARRSVYERAGGFDLAFPRQADFEMAVRLFEIHRIRSRYISEVMVRMRTGGVSNNSMVGIIKGNIEAYRACKKHKLPVSPFFIPCKVMSRIPQFFQRPSGAQNQ